MAPCKSVVLNRRCGKSEVPQADIFSVKDCDEDTELQDGEVLVKTTYLSVDPYMRYKMLEETGTFYLEPWQVGQPCDGGGVGIVIQSKFDGLAPNDTVKTFYWPWKTTCKIDGKILEKVEHDFLKLKPSLALGTIGIIGLTSYIGLKEKGKIQPGKNQCVVISGAAGACGTVAGQVARVMGAGSVIGICGSEAKCKYIVEELGFNAAINYKTDNIPEALKRLCPDGIDVYFDNVGGEISDEVIKQMNKNSNIVLCGQISMYNKDIPYPPPLQTEIEAIRLSKNISRERFLVLNHQDEWKETIDILARLYQEGKLNTRETVTEGIENIGHAFISVMTGGNFGKQVVKLA